MPSVGLDGFLEFSSLKSDPLAMQQQQELQHQGSGTDRARFEKVEFSLSEKSQTESPLGFFAFSVSECGYKKWKEMWTDCNASPDMIASAHGVLRTKMSQAASDVERIQNSPWMSKAAHYSQLFELLSHFVCIAYLEVSLHTLSCREVPHTGIKYLDNAVCSVCQTALSTFSKIYHGDFVGESLVLGQNGGDLGSKISFWCQEMAKFRRDLGAFFADQGGSSPFEIAAKAISFLSDERNKLSKDCSRVRKDSAKDVELYVFGLDECVFGQFLLGLFALEVISVVCCVSFSGEDKLPVKLWKEEPANFLKCLNGVLSSYRSLSLWDKECDLKCDVLRQAEDAWNAYPLLLRTSLLKFLELGSAPAGREVVNTMSQMLHWRAFGKHGEFFLRGVSSTSELDNSLISVLSSIAQLFSEWQSLPVALPVGESQAHMTQEKLFGRQKIAYLAESMVKSSSKRVCELLQMTGQLRDARRDRLRIWGDGVGLNCCAVREIAYCIRNERPKIPFSFTLTDADPGALNQAVIQLSGQFEDAERLTILRDLNRDRCDGLETQTKMKKKKVHVYSIAFALHQIVDQQERLKDVLRFALRSTAVGGVISLPDFGAGSFVRCILTPQCICGREVGWLGDPFLRLGEKDKPLLKVKDVAEEMLNGKWKLPLPLHRYEHHVPKFEKLPPIYCFVPIVVVRASLKEVNNLQMVYNEVTASSGLQRLNKLAESMWKRRLRQSLSNIYWRDKFNIYAHVLSVWHRQGSTVDGGLREILLDVSEDMSKIYKDNRPGQFDDGFGSDEWTLHNALGDLHGLSDHPRLPDRLSELWFKEEECLSMMDLLKHYENELTEAQTSLGHLSFDGWRPLRGTVAEAEGRPTSESQDAAVVSDHNRRANVFIGHCIAQKLMKEFCGRKDFNVADLGAGDGATSMAVAEQLERALIALKIQSRRHLYVYAVENNADMRSKLRQKIGESRWSSKESSKVLNVVFYVFGTDMLDQIQTWYSERKTFFQAIYASFSLHHVSSSVLSQVLSWSAVVLEPRGLFVRADPVLGQSVLNRSKLNFEPHGLFGFFDSGGPFESKLRENLFHVLLRDELAEPLKDSEGNVCGEWADEFDDIVKEIDADEKHKRSYVRFGQKGEPSRFGSHGELPPWYVEPPQYAAAKEALKMKKCVVILGEAGVGKSLLASQLAFDLCDIKQSDDIRARASDLGGAEVDDAHAEEHNNGGSSGASVKYALCWISFETSASILSTIGLYSGEDERVDAQKFLEEKAIQDGLRRWCLTAGISENDINTNQPAELAKLIQDSGKHVLVVLDCPVSSVYVKRFWDICALTDCTKLIVTFRKDVPQRRGNLSPVKHEGDSQRRDNISNAFQPREENFYGTITLEHNYRMAKNIYNAVWQMKLPGVPKGVSTFERGPGKLQERDFFEACGRNPLCIVAYTTARRRQARGQKNKIVTPPTFAVAGKNVIPQSAELSNITETSLEKSWQGLPDREREYCHVVSLLVSASEGVSLRVVECAISGAFEASEENYACAKQMGILLFPDIALDDKKTEKGIRMPRGWKGLLDGIHADSMRESHEKICRNLWRAYVAALGDAGDRSRAVLEYCRRFLVLHVLWSEKLKVVQETIMSYEWFQDRIGSKGWGNLGIQFLGSRRRESLPEDVGQRREVLGVAALAEDFRLLGDKFDVLLTVALELERIPLQYSSEVAVSTILPHLFHLVGSGKPVLEEFVATLRVSDMLQAGQEIPRIFPVYSEPAGSRHLAEVVALCGLGDWKGFVSLDESGATVVWKAKDGAEPVPKRTKNCVWPEILIRERTAACKFLVQNKTTNPTGNGWVKFSLDFLLYASNSRKGYVSVERHFVETGDDPCPVESWWRRRLRYGLHVSESGKEHSTSYSTSYSTNFRGVRALCTVPVREESVLVFPVAVIAMSNGKLRLWNTYTMYEMWEKDFPNVPEAIYDKIGTVQDLSVSELLHVPREDESVYLICRCARGFAVVDVGLLTEGRIPNPSYDKRDGNNVFRDKLIELQNERRWASAVVPGLQGVAGAVLGTFLVVLTFAVVERTHPNSEVQIVAYGRSGSALGRFRNAEVHQSRNWEYQLLVESGSSVLVSSLVLHANGGGVMAVAVACDKRILVLGVECKRQADGKFGVELRLVLDVDVGQTIGAVYVLKVAERSSVVQLVYSVGHAVHTQAVQLKMDQKVSNIVPMQVLQSVQPLQPLVSISQDGRFVVRSAFARFGPVIRVIELCVPRKIEEMSGYPFVLVQKSMRLYYLNDGKVFCVDLGDAWDTQKRTYIGPHMGPTGYTALQLQVCEIDSLRRTIVCVHSRKSPSGKVEDPVDVLDAYLFSGPDIEEKSRKEFNDRIWKLLSLQDRLLVLVEESAKDGTGICEVVIRRDSGKLQLVGPRRSEFSSMLIPRGSPSWIDEGLGDKSASRAVWFEKSLPAGEISACANTTGYLHSQILSCKDTTVGARLDQDIRAVAASDSLAVAVGDGGFIGIFDVRRKQELYRVKLCGAPLVCCALSRRVQLEVSVSRTETQSIRGRTLVAVDDCGTVFVFMLIPRLLEKLCSFRLNPSAIDHFSRWLKAAPPEQRPRVNDFVLRLHDRIVAGMPGSFHALDCGLSDRSEDSRVIEICNPLELEGVSRTAVFVAIVRVLEDGLHSEIADYFVDILGCCGIFVTSISPHAKWDKGKLENLWVYQRPIVLGVKPFGKDYFCIVDSTFNKNPFGGKIREAGKLSLASSFHCVMHGLLKEEAGEEGKFDLWVYKFYYEADTMRPAPSDNAPKELANESGGSCLFGLNYDWPEMIKRWNAGFKDQFGRDLPEFAHSVPSVVKCGTFRVHRGNVQRSGSWKSDRGTTDYVSVVVNYGEALKADRKTGWRPACFFMPRVIKELCGTMFSFRCIVEESMQVSVVVAMRRETFVDEKGNKRHYSLGTLLDRGFDFDWMIVGQLEKDVKDFRARDGKLRGISDSACTKYRALVRKKYRLRSQEAPDKDMVKSVLEETLESQDCSVLQDSAQEPLKRQVYQYKLNVTEIDEGPPGSRTMYFVTAVVPSKDWEGREIDTGISSSMNMQVKVGEVSREKSDGSAWLLVEISQFCSSSVFDMTGIIAIEVLAVGFIHRKSFKEQAKFQNEIIRKFCRIEDLESAPDGEPVAVRGETTPPEPSSPPGDDSSGAGSFGSASSADSSEEPTSVSASVESGALPTMDAVPDSPLTVKVPAERTSGRGTPRTGSGSRGAHFALMCDELGRASPAIQGLLRNAFSLSPGLEGHKLVDEAVEGKKFTQGNVRELLDLFRQSRYNGTDAAQAVEKYWSNWLQGKEISPR